MKPTTDAPLILHCRRCKKRTDHVTRTRYEKKGFSMGQTVSQKYHVCMTCALKTEAR